MMAWSKCSVLILIHPYSENVEKWYKYMHINIIISILLLFVTYPHHKNRPFSKCRNCVSWVVRLSGRHERWDNSTFPRIFYCSHLYSLQQCSCLFYMLYGNKQEGCYAIFVQLSQLNLIVNLPVFRKSTYILKLSPPLLMQKSIDNPRVFYFQKSNVYLHQLFQDCGKLECWRDNSMYEQLIWIIYI